MPFADLDGVRLHYELSGEPSAHVIVLAHSLGANLHMWDKIVPALARQYRVLRYDTRGHGATSVPTAACTVTQLAGDAIALLNHLQIDLVHFCGLSLGGIVGMALAIHEPQRINRLVLANTAARIGTREGWDERITFVRTSGLQELSHATPARWFSAGFRDTHPAEMDTIRAMIVNTSLDGYIACCEALRDADLRPEVPAIDAPTLIISGAEDPATPPSDGRWLQQAIKSSEYLELPTAHLSAWECPQEFQRAVLDHLR